MNFEELNDELSALYKRLKEGKVDTEVAQQLNDTAANIQSNIRLGLLNARLRNEQPDLKFFKKKVVRRRTGR